MSVKNLKLVLAAFLLCTAAAFSSCSQAEISTEGNFIKVVLLQGNGEGGEYEVTFDLAAPSSPGIFAKHTSAADDASADRYSVCAYSAYEAPYCSCQLYLVPGHKAKDGSYAEPQALVTFTEFTIDDTPIPQSRTFRLTADSHFGRENYHVPQGKGGKLTVSWKVDDAYSEVTSSGTTYSKKSYSIKGLYAVATVQ